MQPATPENHPPRKLRDISKDTALPWANDETQRAVETAFTLANALHLVVAMIAGLPEQVRVRCPNGYCRVDGKVNRACIMCAGYGYLTPADAQLLLPGVGPDSGY